MQNIAELHEQLYAHLTTKYPDLTFSLRKNRGERLDAGYWFSGADNYLAFSFWQGLDWRNKTPNIFFAISANGTPTLEFVCYDNPDIIKILGKISLALRMVQKKRKKTGQTFEHWVKNYDTTDYIAALEEFIQQHKPVIDTFIEVLDTNKDLQPIDSQTFKKNKDAIELIRTSSQREALYKKKWAGTHSIYLKTLNFENITLYKNKQNIEFFSKDKFSNVTCFIGLNGTGKTSILRAIVLAFIGYENEIIGNDEKLDKLQKMLTISGVELKGVIQYANKGNIKIEYKTYLPNNDLPVSYNNEVLLEYNRDKNQVEISDHSDSDFKNIVDGKPISLFLAFPQLQGKPTDSESTEDQRKTPLATDFLSMINNEPDDRFGSFSRWLASLYFKANDKVANKVEATPIEGILLEKVFEIISLVTGEKTKLHSIYPKSNGESEVWVILKEGSDPIPFDLISQGFSNIFSWVGYMMQRLSEVTPDARKESFMETPAIVLIDEIDTYLHISVQQKILAVLVEKFPNIQFIVTTHSPYTIGSIPNDKIKIYVCRKEGESVEVEAFTDFTAYGADVERLSRRVFGTQGRTEDAQIMLNEIFKCIENGQLDIAEQKILAASEIIDSSDPKLEEARMIIETQKMFNI